MTQSESMWASYLQAIQLVDAMGQMLPYAKRPPLKPSVSSRLKVIENNCREISEYLNRHMDTENMEEFLDKNAELFNFMKAFHALSYEQREGIVQLMQTQTP